MEKISFDAVVAEQVKRKSEVVMEYALQLKRKIDAITKDKLKVEDELTALCAAPIVVAYEMVHPEYRKKYDRYTVIDDRH
jgi:hypothetical protein